MTEKTTICIDSLRAPQSIRQERVDAIKTAMVAGVYRVSNSQLASALFNEFFAHRPTTFLAAIGRKKSAQLARRSQ